MSPPLLASATLIRQLIIPTKLDSERVPQSRVRGVGSVPGTQRWPAADCSAPWGATPAPPVAFATTAGHSSSITISNDTHAPPESPAGCQVLPLPQQPAVLHPRCIQKQVLPGRSLLSTLAEVDGGDGSSMDTPDLFSAAGQMFGTPLEVAALAPGCCCCSSPSCMLPSAAMVAAA